MDSYGCMRMYVDDAYGCIRMHDGCIRMHANAYVCIWCRFRTFSARPGPGYAPSGETDSPDLSYKINSIINPCFELNISNVCKGHRSQKPCKGLN